MNAYEMLFIYRQDISKVQVEKLTDSFKDVITDASGVIGRHENWGLETLAYRIKKNRKGHIVLLNFESPPEVVKEIERKMNLSEDVLRFLTIRTEKLETEDSIRSKTSDRELPKISY